MIKKIILAFILTIAFASSTFAYNSTTYSVNAGTFTGTIPTSLVIGDSIAFKFDMQTATYDQVTNTFRVGNNLTYVSKTIDCGAGFLSTFETTFPNYKELYFSKMFDGVCTGTYNFTVTSIGNVDVVILDGSNNVIETKVLTILPNNIPNNDNLGTGIQMNEDGSITVVQTDLTKSANSNYLQTIFEMLKFIPTIAALAAGFYILNRVFQMIPRGK